MSKKILVTYFSAGGVTAKVAWETGSGMGRTNDKLKPSCPGATLLKGKLLNGEVSEDTMKRWLKDLNL